MAQRIQENIILFVSAYPNSVWTNIQKGCRIKTSIIPLGQEPTGSLLIQNISWCQDWNCK